MHTLNDFLISSNTVCLNEMDDPWIERLLQTNMLLGTNCFHPSIAPFLVLPPPCMLGWSSSAFPTTSKDYSWMSSKWFPLSHVIIIHVFHDTRSNSRHSMRGGGGGGGLVEFVLWCIMFLEWVHWGVVECKILLCLHNTHWALIHRHLTAVTTWLWKGTFTSVDTCFYLSVCNSLSSVHWWKQQPFKLRCWGMRTTTDIAVLSWNLIIQSISVMYNTLYIIHYVILR